MLGVFMTEFKFEGVKNSYSYTNKKTKKLGKVKIQNFDLLYENNEKYELTISLTEYLQFLSDNNLVPKLPDKIKIEYVQEDNLIHKAQLLFGKNYEYPACMNPYNNTLYISNDFKRHSELKNNLYITNARNFFNGSIQKALEYAFGHELGHFNLLSKNLGKKLLPKNEVILTLARSIEESFAESFSIQIMLIKYPNLLNDTKNFENLKNYLDTLNEKTEINKLIDSYYFPEVYKNLPFKDSKGNIETDIDKIYDNCYQLALINNKEVIKDIFDNPKINKLEIAKTFKSSLEKYLEDEIQKEKKENNNNVFTNEDLISVFHKKMKTLEFTTKVFKGLRDKYINKKIDNKNKM